MKKILMMATAALLMTACSDQKKADDPLADTGRTQRTENLLTNLKALCDSSVWLFGHQDDTVYGIGWEADYANDSTIHQRSDVKSVCNDFPALLGFELRGIENGDDRNIDGVPFNRIQKEAVAHFDRGGMVTLSWTVEKEEQSEANIDRVAHFLNTLETPYGVKVPVLFRLRGAFTKALWQTVVRRLKENGVVNALYVYSAQCSTSQSYLDCFPDDDIIDLLGLDCYCIAPEADTVQIADYVNQLDKNLDIVCQLAKKRQKAVALTETGYENIKTEDWWTKTLAPVLARHPISYVLIWRNAYHTQALEPESHYFAPYPGHKSTSDFIRFYNDKQSLFLSDVNGLYRNS